MLIYLDSCWYLLIFCSIQLYVAIFVGGCWYVLIFVSNYRCLFTFVDICSVFIDICSYLFIFIQMWWSLFQLVDNCLELFMCGNICWSSFISMYHLFIIIHMCRFLTFIHIYWYLLTFMNYYVCWYLLIFVNICVYSQIFIHICF